MELGKYTQTVDYRKCGKINTVFLLANTEQIPGTQVYINQPKFINTDVFYEDVLANIELG